MCFSLLSQVKVVLWERVGRSFFWYSYCVCAGLVPLFHLGLYLGRWSMGKVSYSCVLVWNIFWWRGDFELYMMWQKG